MKAAAFVKPHNMAVIETEQPSLGENHVLIKVHNAGICGTDIHMLPGEYPATYPIIPGHEFSGTVVAVGDNVKHFDLGDRVTADTNIPCNRCFYCQRNQPNQCVEISIVGVTRAGGFAE
jgi:D-arabinitol dehydrogenase (NADP+)